MAHTTRQNERPNGPTVHLNVDFTKDVAEWIICSPSCSNILSNPFSFSPMLNDGINCDTTLGYFPDSASNANEGDAEYNV